MNTVGTHLLTMFGFYVELYMKGIICPTISFFALGSEIYKTALRVSDWCGFVFSCEIYASV